MEQIPAGTYTYILLITHLALLGAALRLDLQTYLCRLSCTCQNCGAAQQHMKNLICYKVIFFPPNTSVHTWRWQKHIWEFAIPHRGYELVSLFCQQAWCLSLVVIIERLVICQAWLFLSQGATWRLSNGREKLYQALEIIKSHSPWLWKVEVLTSVFSTDWTLRP